MTAKIGLIFAVQLILPGRPSDFCKHLTDRHHIAQNQTISKSVGDTGKIRQTAWQNQSDVTKIGSTTVCVIWALQVSQIKLKISFFFRLAQSAKRRVRLNSYFQCLWKQTPNLALEHGQTKTRTVALLRNPP